MLGAATKNTQVLDGHIMSRAHVCHSNKHGVQREIVCKQGSTAGQGLAPKSAIVQVPIAPT